MDKKPRPGPPINNSPEHQLYFISESSHPATGCLRVVWYHSILTPGCGRERRNFFLSGLRPGMKQDTSSGSTNDKEAGL